MITLPKFGTENPTKTGTSGPIKLPPLNPAPATPKAVSSTASPSAVGVTQPKPGSYGGSNLTDVSGKPLLTFKNEQAKQSQLLADRTFSGFDPTVPQKLDRSIL